MPTEFISGLGLGMAVAVPIGPMAVLCMGRTIQSGPMAGFATGLGAATVHGLFGSLAAVGFGMAHGGWLTERTTS